MATVGPQTAVAPQHEVQGKVDAWVREATRLHQRYMLEIVEHYGLCPWATRARVGDHLRVEVCLQPDDTSLEPALAGLERWRVDSAMEVGFLLFPRLPLPRSDFDRFVGAIRTAESGRHELGSAPFAMVGFHPEAAPVLDDAERLIPFLRRTPDPCIQVVRIDVLDRVRGTVPEGTQFVDLALLEAAAAKPPELSVRERVGRTNLQTLRRIGVDEVRDRMDAIRLDRHTTYAKLGPVR